MNSRPSFSAVPDDTNAIRGTFDQGEPAAIVFSEGATPGALVSWAWCQLSALDALLVAMIEARPTDGDDASIAEAARVILVPAINALRFSELRAERLREVFVKV